MRQTLFYIPHELFGLPVFGVGLLLGVWVVLSAALLYVLVRRQGFGAETKSYLPVLGIVGVVIAMVLPNLEVMEHGQLQGVPIRGYGVLLLLAVVSGVALSAWRARQMGIDPEIIFSLALWMFVSGIVGARAFFVIQKWNDLPHETWSQLFNSVFNVAQGGLVVYGSLLAVLPAMVLFARLKRLPLLALADLIAPGMAIGLALGRIGCLMNGCCYGDVCTAPWAIRFPDGSPPYEEQLSQGLLQGIQLSADEHGTPQVAAIEPDSLAAASGLAVGDRIAAINGRRVSSLEHAEQVLRATGTNVWVKLADGRAAGWPLHASGPSESSLNYFGLRLAADAEGRPVVAELPEESRAAAAGIQPGDVIEAINGQPVADLAAAQQQLYDARSNVWLRTGDNQAIGWSLPRSTLPVHPTQIYSAVNAALLAWVLLAWYPYRRRDGEVLALLLALYAIARFLLEMIRTDESVIGGTGLTISQNVSLGMLALAALLVVYLWRTPPRTAWPPQQA